MALNPSQLEALVFDLDNTLCSFGPVQHAAVCGALHQHLVRLFGPIDPHHVEVLWNKARQAPYKGAAHTLKEHDYEVLLAHIVTTLYGHAPDVVRLEQLRFALYSHYVNLVTFDNETREILARLKARFRLVLLTNYPDTHAVRDALRVHHLRDLFENIAVSGEIGYVKPHPVTFAQALSPLHVAPEHAAYIGDELDHDIQGAKSAGLQTIWMTRYLPEGHPAAKPGEMPDLEIKGLAELESALA